MVLGVGRAIGEAMAVMMVSGNVPNMPSLFQSVRFLTTAVASEMGYAAAGLDVYKRQTVDSAVRTTFRENVAHVLNGKAPDYLVVHHMEPDHAAEMADLAQMCIRDRGIPGQILPRR